MVHPAGALHCTALHCMLYMMAVTALLEKAEMSWGWFTQQQEMAPHLEKSKERGFVLLCMILNKYRVSQKKG
jgi:hypothetical protein